MRRVTQSMGEHGFQLGLAKMEVLVLSVRWIETILLIRIGDRVIDTKLTFAEHL